MSKSLLFFFLVISLIAYSQESVNLRFGAGASYMNYFIGDEINQSVSYYPEINVQEKWGSNFEANIEFRLNKHFQFESGLMYQQFDLDYTFFTENNSPGFKISKNEATVDQSNQMLLVPLGASLVLPFKKSEFLFGVKFFYQFKHNSKKGTWRYCGKENIMETDSGLVYDEFDITYTDDEIGDVLSPQLKTQYHLAYQLKISEKWQVYAKFMAGTGELSRRYDFNYWQYSAQFGLVYKLIDYKAVKQKQAEYEKINQVNSSL